MTQHRVNLLPWDSVNMGEGDKENHPWLRKPVRQVAGREEQGNSTHACPVTVLFSGIH